MTDSTPTAVAGLSAPAVRPLHTLDPYEPLDDLDWLDEAIGAARVVAIGESAHYNAETYRLRHRILRYLVERHGFGAYAMESGFAEGWRTDEWVRGGEDDLGQVLANGLTSLMGMWTQMRAHLEWMRDHNRTAARPVGFYGADLSGSNASLLPSLDAVIAYLAGADPDYQVDPGIRETAAVFAASSAFSIPAAIGAYAQLRAETRDALSAGLAELAVRVTGRRLEYVRRTTIGAYERALRSLYLTITLDALVRAMARGDRPTVMSDRDAAIADNLEWILRREDRIVLGAHNGHIQRRPLALPGMPETVTPAGVHLADRLGEGYLVIGITAGSGQALNTDADFYTGTLFTDMGPPAPGTLDALMAASHDGPFATDLRRLSPADADAVRAADRQRFGTFHVDLNPLDAYDVIVHLPEVTAAESDPAAVACAPDDVRETFSRWNPH